jgi:hypothetical protein
MLMKGVVGMVEAEERGKQAEAEILSMVMVVRSSKLTMEPGVGS